MNFRLVCMAVAVCLIACEQPSGGLDFDASDVSEHVDDETSESVAVDSGASDATMDESVNSSATSSSSASSTVTTGSNTTSDPSTTQTTATDSNQSTATMSDVQAIFDSRCSCHLSSSGGGGLFLKDGESWSQLVGQPSSADLLLVQTGALDESYLVYKIRGTQSQVSGGNGSRMPKRSMFSTAQIAVIESWITNGAPP